MHKLGPDQLQWLQFCMQKVHLQCGYLGMAALLSSPMRNAEGLPLRCLAVRKSPG